MLSIEHTTVYTPTERIDDATVVIENGHITYVGASRDALVLPESTRVDGQN